MALFEHNAYHLRNDKARQMITLGHMEDFDFNFLVKTENILNLF